MERNNMRSAHTQRGVTLVELMVALLLGLVLTGGAIQIFIGNRATYAFNEGLSRLQENGRFAIDTLNFRTRMAGYFGCLPDITVYNNLDVAANSLAFDFQTPLQGFEADGTDPGQTFDAEGVNPAAFSPALPASLSGEVLAGSDAIVIRNVSPASHALISPFNDSAQKFVDMELDDYTEGEIAIISDCQKATVFQITNVSANGPSTGITVAHAIGTYTPGNIEAEWDSLQQYGQGSEMLRGEVWVYYVGQGDRGPALFQQRLGVGGTTASLITEELVEGVDTMQVLYGRDPDGDGDLDDYVPADQVGDWGEVVAVRIGLLVRSPEEYGSEFDRQEYNVNGTVFDPADDRRVRQVFTTTVALRNRLP